MPYLHLMKLNYLVFELYFSSYWPIFKEVKGNQKFQSKHTLHSLPLVPQVFFVLNKSEIKENEKLRTKY